MIINFPTSWHIAIALYVLGFGVSIWFGISGYKWLDKYRDDDEEEIA